MRVLNEALLRETLQYIKEHPQQWNQEVWFTWKDANGNRLFDAIEVEFEEVNSCNSAFCFAGHAALKSGFGKPPKDSNRVWEYDGVEVSEWATDKLGLTWDQADVLFSSSNTMEDLELIVNAILENPNIGGDELYDLTSKYDDDYCTCCSSEDDE